MSWKFCQELDDFLSNEWIKVADICAIFAGWIPISPYIPDYSYERGYGPRMYLRLEDGKRVTPGQEGFKEIIRIQKKWSGSSWDFTTRYSNVVDHDPMNEEIRVRDAFKIGLAMRVDRVALIFDAAVEQGIVADIVAVKTLMNHANIATTAEYITHNDEYLKKVVMNVQATLFEFGYGTTPKELRALVYSLT